MNINQIPNLCSKTICVTNNPTFGAIISAYFHGDDYFGIVESPRTGRPDWTNDVIRITNLFAGAHMNKIVLASVDADVESEFRKSFRGENVIVIKKIDEINEKILQLVNPKFNGILKCIEKELPYGLLLSKIKKLELRIDNSAESIINLLDSELAGKRHCVVIENHNDIISIIAVNYAYSLNADLLLISPVPENKVREIYDQVSIMGLKRNVQKRELAEKEITSKSELYKKEIDLNGKEFVTYFTKGTPFGYFLNHIPSTHLLTSIHVGPCIIEAINYSNYISDTRLALILDPGFFKDSECSDISSNLGRKGIPVKEVTGDEATAFNLKSFISFYPYDLLYICSHAGEHSEGEELTVDFLTKKHGIHKIKFQFSYTFALTNEGVGDDRKVEVFQQITPMELDGISWKDKDKKKEINAKDIITEFYKIDPSEWKIVERKDIDSIREFAVIRATDGDCPIATHHVAGSPRTCPIVFNNACNSIYGFYQWFLAAGSRSYIGTLTSVNDTDAKSVAKKFFSEVNEQTPLPITLWQSQSSVYSNPIHRTYIHFGCHFIKIITPPYDMTNYPEFAITKEIEMWTKQQAEGVAEETSKDAPLRVIKFLTDTLDN